MLTGWWMVVTVCIVLPPTSDSNWISTTWPSLGLVIWPLWPLMAYSAMRFGAFHRNCSLQICTSETGPGRMPAEWRVNYRNAVVLFNEVSWHRRMDDLRTEWSYKLVSTCSNRIWYLSRRTLPAVFRNLTDKSQAHRVSRIHHRTRCVVVFAVQCKFTRCLGQPFGTRDYLDQCTGLNQEFQSKKKKEKEVNLLRKIDAQEVKVQP